MRRWVLFNFNLFSVLRDFSNKFSSYKGSSVLIDFCSRGVKVSDGVMRLYQIDDKTGVKVELESKDLPSSQELEVYNNTFIDADIYWIFLKEYYIQRRLYMMWVLYNEEYDDECYMEDWIGRHDDYYHKVLRSSFACLFSEFSFSIYFYGSISKSIQLFDPNMGKVFPKSFHFYNKKSFSLNNFLVYNLLSPYYSLFLPTKLFNYEFPSDSDFLDFLYNNNLPIRSVKSWIRSYNNLRLKSHNLYMYTPNHLYVTSKFYSSNIIKSFYTHLIKINSFSKYFYTLFYRRLYREEFGLFAATKCVYRGSYNSVFAFKTFNLRDKFFNVRSRDTKGLVKPNDILEVLDEDPKLEWIQSYYMWSDNRFGFNKSSGEESKELSLKKDD